LLADGKQLVLIVAVVVVQKTDQKLQNPTTGCCYLARIEAVMMQHTD